MAPSPVMVSTPVSESKFHVSGPVVPLVCARAVFAAANITMMPHKRIKVTRFIVVNSLVKTLVVNTHQKIHSVVCSVS
jgi:hypothetical protein